MVANFEKTNNQCANFYNSELYSWKGLKFRSKSEIKIAEELDRRGIFFLPNCAGRVGVGSVRRNVEADFLICYNNVWGILEVDGEKYHIDNHEDQVRDAIINESINICTISRYPSKDCFSQPAWVVSDFLIELDTHSNEFEVEQFQHLTLIFHLKRLDGLWESWKVFKSTTKYKDDFLDKAFKQQKAILELDCELIVADTLPHQTMEGLLSHANWVWREMLDTVCSDYPLNFWEYLTFVYKFKQLLDSEWSCLVEDKTKELFIKMSSCQLGSIPFTRFEWQ